jgi:hypothetical protein
LALIYKHTIRHQKKRGTISQFALIQHHIDRGNPIYRAVEDRIKELEKIERLTRGKKEKWKDWIITFFIILAVCLIGVIIEKCVFKT